MAPKIAAGPGEVGDHRRWRPIDLCRWRGQIPRLLRPLQSLSELQRSPKQSVSYIPSENVTFCNQQADAETDDSSLRTACGSRERPRPPDATFAAHS